MENPVKVLIVDDEVPVRREMAAYPWESYGCCWVGEAKNGKEALQLCSDLKPDIVICDISMPVMNGLELAETLQTLYPAVQVIILTGHENFDYVKTALRLNVVDYVVKFEMNEESIGAVIEKARKKMTESGILKQSENKEMRRKVTKYLLRLQNDRTAEPEVRAEVENILQALHVLPDPQGRCTFLYADIPDEFSVAVHEELSEYLESHKEVAGWSMLLSDVYAVRLTENCGCDYRECLRTLCRDIRNYLEALTEIPKLFAVTYREVRKLDQLVACMKDLPIWKETYFYDAPEMIYEGGKLSAMCGLNMETEEELSRIFCLIESDREGFKKRLTTYAGANRVEPAGLKLFTARWLKNYLEKSGRAYGDYFDLDIQETGTVSDLADYAVQSCIAETEYRVEIKKAIRIINEEYRNRLQLSEVAYRIGLSAQYFSRLFREETGKTYSDYLIAVRIERAQELLREGRFKVYEIAEMVGIPNYRYFSALFKRMTGFAPKQAGKGSTNV